jgi:hypothetical protein
MIILLIGCSNNSIKGNDVSQSTNDDADNNNTEVVVSVPDKPLFSDVCVITQALEENGDKIFRDRDGVKIYNNDVLIWDSQQGEFIAYADDNLYYRVGEQLRYVNTREKQPKIIQEEYFKYLGDYDNVNSKQIPNSDYFLLTDGRTSGGSRGYNIIIDAKWGMNPDRIEFKRLVNSSSYDPFIYSYTYNNGWLYFTMDANRYDMISPVYRALLRIELDSYKVENNGNIYEVNIDNIEMLNSYFNEAGNIGFADRDYEIIGDYIYFPRENMQGKHSDSRPDRLCARRNLSTGEKELLYEFPMEEGVKKLSGITRMLRTDNYIIYYVKYLDGKLQSHKAFIYNTDTYEYSVIDTDYPSILDEKILFKNENVFLSDNILYSIKTDGNSIYVSEINRFEGDKGLEVFEYDSKMFIFEKKTRCLYYYDQENEELIKSEYTYPDDVCYVKAL